ncbi:putative RanBPM protein [Guillardia theta]|uniref:Putative RanBPM protein n=1 Tax=Guillardia theta TaxID=55529 RepID=Q9XG39_GUITH|nr:putative RanBPM protein [Guillardia theta]CAB40405.1 putative RanBPM protein [Guillardia theta]|mmetsp:Transcript_20323/g.67878  ORF Transcript_20323/g.67878 Transcript_20323/m.67878 type:complete len:281 (+) Transcript_20323:312-1154(+)
MLITFEIQRYYRKKIKFKSHKMDNKIVVFRNIKILSNFKIPIGIYSFLYNIPAIWSLKERWKWVEKKKRIDWGDLEVSNNGSKVTYKGYGKTDEDAASIRSNYPINKNSLIFYFEVKIINKGREGFIGIGFSIGEIELDRLPGWEKKSLGYHGDDGNLFIDSGIGKKYGPKYGYGDIIGVCWNKFNNSIFFTKNSIPLEYIDVFKVFTDITNVYPIIGLRSFDESIEANFGNKPFDFDINLYYTQNIKYMINKTLSIGNIHFIYRKKKENEFLLKIVNLN